MPRLDTLDWRTMAPGEIRI